MKQIQVGLNFFWPVYVHEVLVNRLGGLSLPRKSVVRLTDRPDMTLDVYCGRKTTNQQPSYAYLAYHHIVNTDSPFVLHVVNLRYGR